MALGKCVPSSCPSDLSSTGASNPLRFCSFIYFVSVDIDVVSTLTSVTPSATFVPGVINGLTFAMTLTNNNDADSNLDVAEVAESVVDNFNVTLRFVDVDISTGSNASFEIAPQSVVVVSGSLTSNLTTGYELAISLVVDVRLLSAVLLNLKLSDTQTVFKRWIHKISLFCFSSTSFLPNASFSTCVLKRNPPAFFRILKRTPAVT